MRSQPLSSAVGTMWLDGVARSSRASAGGPVVWRRSGIYDDVANHCDFRGRRNDVEKLEPLGQLHDFNECFEVAFQCVVQTHLGRSNNLRNIASPTTPSCSGRLTIWRTQPQKPGSSLRSAGGRAGLPSRNTATAGRPRSGPRRSHTRNGFMLDDADVCHAL